MARDHRRANACAWYNPLRFLASGFLLQYKVCHVAERSVSSTGAECGTTRLATLLHTLNLTWRPAERRARDSQHAGRCGVIALERHLLSPFHLRALLLYLMTEIVNRFPLEELLS